MLLLLLLLLLLYQQTRRDPLPHLVTFDSRASPLVRGSERNSHNLQALGDARSRHVCNSVELPPSSVHVSNPGATSPRGGCSVSGLAGEVNVHVSSISPAQQSHSEAQVHTGGRSDSHSPLVA